MLKFLLHRFVPNSDQVGDEAVRTGYGVLAGSMGIALNLLLFAIKLPIGAAMNSIAITSDAFNNISDMGASLITVIGARMAGRRPDRAHPFGHGRIEYVSALIVSFLILLVGFELIKESISKFTAPEPITLQPLLLGILALSMLVKLWMYFYNKKLGALINSSVLRATASDSLNDVYTTGAVVLATVLGKFVDLPVDAVAGLAVSLLILYTGYGVARDTIDLLLGGKPDPALVRKIKRMVLDGHDVVGVHDLILHDYGPGRVMASAHAEVPADADILHAHESIDATEQRIHRELGVPIVIHMDPIAVNCARTDEVFAQLASVLHATNPLFTFHDFRMTDGENRVNLIFDLMVPVELPAAARQRAAREICEKMTELDPRYRCVIQIDEDYVQ